MKIAILGYGRSGKAAKRLAESLGDSCYVFDDNPGAENDFLSSDKMTGLNPELIVASPGVPESSELMRVARKISAPLISELEFGFRHSQIPSLVVTGSNGKTTTVELTTHILNALGFNAIACGNIGLPICDAIIEHRDADCLVVEASSFQLENCFELKPQAAALLNADSDHLDRHSGVEGYIRAKLRIFMNIDKPEQRIVNFKLKDCLRGECVTFSSETSEADIHLDGTKIYLSLGTKIYPHSGTETYHPSVREIINMAQTHLQGRHNAENMMASIALIKNFAGLDAVLSEDFRKAASSFETGAHRIELFAEQDGIKYINDSKATNPASVLAAVNSASCGRNVCLILGGLDKNMDFTELQKAADKIKAAFLIGESSGLIETALSGLTPCKTFENFKEAVFAACNHAKKGDIVLLSPGCASMDMFKNYIERGNIFKKLVNKKLCASKLQC